MKSLVHALFLPLAALCLLALFTGGCVEKKAPSPEPVPASAEPAQPSTPEPEEPEEVLHVHTIQFPGETLGVISKWYTGKFSSWQAIAQANPDLDPRKMQIGTQVLIPKALIVKQGELTEEFVNKYTAKSEDPAVEETRVNEATETLAETAETASEAVVEISEKPKAAQPGPRTPPAPEAAPKKKPEKPKAQEPKLELFGPKDLN